YGFWDMGSARIPHNIRIQFDRIPERRLSRSGFLKQVFWKMLATADTLYLTGQPLDFAMLEAIGTGARRPVACEIGMGRVAAARRVVTDRLATGLPIYGANTGVGSMKDKLWTAGDLVEFNNNLVKAHHFGTGEPFSLPI